MYFRNYLYQWPKVHIKKNKFLRPLWHMGWSRVCFSLSFFILTRNLFTSIYCLFLWGDVGTKWILVVPLYLRPPSCILFRFAVYDYFVYVGFFLLFFFTTNFSVEALDGKGSFKKRNEIVPTFLKQRVCLCWCKCPQVVIFCHVSLIQISNIW